MKKKRTSKINRGDMDFFIHWTGTSNTKGLIPNARYKEFLRLVSMNVPKVFL